MEEDENPTDKEKGKLRRKINARKKNSKWEPPTEEWIKINVDGSVLQDGSATWGFVIRNSLGDIVSLGAEKGNGCSPLMAEVFALRLGLEKALTLGYHSVLVEGDSLTVVNAALGDTTFPWEIDITISEIRNLATKFREAHIRHIFREANRVVDKLVTLRHSLSVLSILSNTELDTLVRKDALGRRVGIAVKKEAPVNFLTDPREGSSTLRHADVLVYEWSGGKHACIDLTGVSPLVSLGNGPFVVGHAALRAASSNVAKHRKACIENQHVFLPFAFDMFDFLAPDAVEILKMVQRSYALQYYVI